MKARAFLFDLDGTLIDSETLWARALLDYLKDLGCVIAWPEMLKIVFGRSWIDIYHDIIRRFPALAKKDVEQMGVELRSYYLRLRVDGKSIQIPGSVALLRRLAAAYPTIVVSGSPRKDVEIAVRDMEAGSLVRFVLGAEDYPYGKPSPSGFLEGARRLGIPPADCVVFEDSTAGVKAAKAAGMYCVALSRPSENPQDVSAADLVLPDLGRFELASLPA